MAVDHLVYAVPDLEQGVALVEARLGVRAVRGGHHESTGTHNALLGLGGASYLEIIAPDPANAQPSRRRPFHLDENDRPRLAGWAAATLEIDQRVERSRTAGYDPGPVSDLSRRRPDGVLLEWRLTRGDATPTFVLPFLIDWGRAAHPSTSAPQGAVLRSVIIEHPDPEGIRRALAALEVEAEVRAAPQPALIARIDTPGLVTVDFR